MTDYLYQQYRDTKKDIAQYMAIETDQHLTSLVKELIVENQRLKEDNKYYRNIEQVLIHNKASQIFDFDDTPMAFNDYMMVNSQLYFMTITFDSKRFDNFHLSNEDSQKDYIIYQLTQLKNSVNFIYGCFEKHQSGVIHAHLIIDPVDVDSFKSKDLKTIKSAFTINPYSKICVDFALVKNLDKVIQYIDNGNKMKYGFFLYYNSQNYL
jgi:hypothetical protein